MSKEVIIIGAGGHAKVIADIIEKNGDKIYGFLDDNKEAKQKILHKYEVLGKISECEYFQENSKNLYFIIAIGDNYIRKNIFDKYKLNYYTAIHPSSIISSNVKIGEGTAIMANACINAGTRIGKNCIINTAAIIEHDNIIGDNVHISSNATLNGTVEIGELSYIKSGAVIEKNIKIKGNSIVEAGSIILKDI